MVGLARHNDIYNSSLIVGVRRSVRMQQTNPQITKSVLILE